MAIGRAVLDGMKCQTPGCDCGGVLYLTPKCHPSSNLTVRYFAGILEVLCATCRERIVEVRVHDDRRNGHGRVV